MSHNYLIAMVNKKKVKMLDQNILFAARIDLLLFIAGFGISLEQYYSFIANTWIPLQAHYLNSEYLGLIRKKKCILFNKAGPHVILSFRKEMVKLS